MVGERVVPAKAVRCEVALAAPIVLVALISLMPIMLVIGSGVDFLCAEAEDSGLRIWQFAVSRAHLVAGVALVTAVESRLCDKSGPM